MDKERKLMTIAELNAVFTEAETEYGCMIDEDDDLMYCANEYGTLSVAIQFFNCNCDNEVGVYVYDYEYNTENTEYLFVTKQAGCFKYADELDAFTKCIKTSMHHILSIIAKEKENELIKEINEL